MSMSDDSLFMNNVRVRIVKSKDSLFHMSATKYSNGADEGAAMQNIKEINYGIDQQDSTVWLDRGFALKKGTRFRNQGVAVTLQVPVGKRIMIDHSVNRRLNWFRINMGHNDWEWDDEWNGNRAEDWNSDVEYIMTAGGLERVDKKDEHAEESGVTDENDVIEKYNQSKEELQRQYDKKKKEAEDLKKELDKGIDSTKYHYKKASTATAPAPEKAPDAATENQPG
jgi:hypothetical protein